MLFSSCKMPVVLVATKENSKNYNCEVDFFTKQPMTNLDTLKLKFKHEIIKEAKRCKCDTLLIDFNNVFNAKEEHANNIWGFCKSNKK